MHRVRLSFLLPAFALAACGGDPTLSEAEDPIGSSAQALSSGPQIHRTRGPQGGAGPIGQAQPPITYHGGPVMRTANIYYIWYGNWAGNTTTTILTDLARNIGNSQYYNTNVTYSDASGNALRNGVSYAASTTVAYPYGASLTDAEIRSVVTDAINGGALAKDVDGVYFVLTSPDVTVPSGFCTSYCGWHTHATIGGVDIKYSFVGDAATQCPASCIWQTASSPNSNVGADGMASVLIHELEEATSDPDLNAWYDSNGQENADKCAWTFGTTYAAPNGSQANVRLGGHDYLIQQNWVNEGAGYCAMSYGQWAQGFQWWSGASAPTTYGYNSSGGVNTVTALGVGSYRVDFPGLNTTTGAGNGGNVQVTAYGGTNERCKVSSWGAGAPTTTLSVNVRCHTAAGAAVNSPFVALFRREIASNTMSGGYLWANSPASASYTPSAFYQWNSMGLKSTISRTSAGVYSVTLAGSNTVGGNVQVTAYGSGSEHCKVASWGPSGANTVIGVRCFSTTGVAADSMFTLSYHYNTISATMNGLPGWPQRGGFAWANDAASASYTPSTTYQKINYTTCSSPTVTGGRTGLGSYFLDYPNLSATSSAPIVTAYGTGAEYCKLVNWFASGTGTRVQAKCFSGTGAAVDTRYSEVYMVNALKGLCIVL